MENGKIPGRKWIYVLADEHGRVKIGITADLNKRRSQYKTHNPDKLRLVFVQSCLPSKARQIEFFAKNILATNKKHGEWFNDTPENAKSAVMNGMKKCGQLLYSTMAWKGQFSISSWHACICLHDQSMEQFRSCECMYDIRDVEIRNRLGPEDVKKLSCPIYRDYRFISDHSSGYIHRINLSASFPKPMILGGRESHFIRTTKKIEQVFTASSAFEYVEDIFAKYPAPEMQEV